MEDTRACASRHRPTCAFANVASLPVLMHLFLKLLYSSSRRLLGLGDIYWMSLAIAALTGIGLWNTSRGCHVTVGCFWLLAVLPRLLNVIVES
jgi:hypothetical protein